MRIAGAPISWGVCEVPGWGYQLPVDRVLREMAEVPEQDSALDDEPVGEGPVADVRRSADHLRSLP